MSQPFPLKVGDTKREIARKFSMGGRLVPGADLQSVVMRIHVNGTTLERGMTRDGDFWVYKFVGADFVAVPAGEYDVDFRLTWTDGGDATDPSSGRYKLVVESLV